MTEYMVTSESLCSSDKLMNDFIYLLHNTGEIKRVDRHLKIVYLNDNTSYKFVKDDRKYTDGFRGKIYSHIEFENKMKNFKDGWNKQWWITRKIMKVINKLTGAV